MLTPAVFFDRDGILNETFVVNGKPFAPRKLEDFKLKAGAERMVKRFKTAGYKTIVVTNQPDVGNGLVAQSVVESMHNVLKQALPIDKIKVCYHSQQDCCDCRKPKPGMLRSAAVELDLDLARSVLVGDRASDVAAGHSVGCFTVYLDCGYNERLNVEPDCSVYSLDGIMPLI